MPTARTGQKHYACQVPLALAARLEALFDMHPEKQRSQLMADLLALGLDQVERTRSGLTLAEPEPLPDAHAPIYLLTGPFDAFHGLVHKHHLALERALDEADTPPGSAQDYRLNPDD